MSVIDAGRRTLRRGYRRVAAALRPLADGYGRVVDRLPIEEDRLLDFLKRALPTVWFGTMVGVTLVIMLIISFQPTTDTDIFVAEHTLENYRKIVEQPQYARVFFKTVRISAGAALLAVVLSYPSTYYIGVKLPDRHQYPVVLGIIVPMWTLFIIRVYAWMTILGTNGTLHKLLRLLDALLRTDLVDPNFTLLNTRVAVIVVLAQVWFPMAFLPLYSAMSGIDDEYFEAAKDLGATRRDVFRHIVFPLTLPSAFGAFLLVFLPAMGSYVIPLLVGGQKGFMIARIVASQFLDAYNWPFGAALAVVLALVVLALIGVLQRVINFREALGGFA